MSKSGDVEDQPRWRRRKEARRPEIVLAAYDTFVEKGFAAARMDEIAAKAGVSKGAVYLYFRTKSDVFEAVVRDTVAPNFDVIEQLAAAHPGPFADFVRLALPRIAEVVAGTSVAKVAKMVIGESGNFPELARIWHDTLVDRGLGLLSRLIAEGQARGEIRPGDPRHHALSLMSPLIVSLLFKETFVPAGARGFDIPTLMRQHVETALEGMQTRREP
jgi:AcrR family transcriptional regulator